MESDWDGDHFPTHTHAHTCACTHKHTHKFKLKLVCNTNLGSLCLPAGTSVNKVICSSFRAIPGTGVVWMPHAGKQVKLSWLIKIEVILPLFFLASLRHELHCFSEIDLFP